VLATALALELDAGEAAAIALALEEHADLLLLDELRARKVAGRFELRTMGLLGVLKLAKSRQIIPAIAPLITRLEIEAGFWLGADLRHRVLCEAGEPES
jgi:hypothetical protein